MLKEFKTFVEKHNLIGKDDRILLALSGGVDSMVLAKLLLKLQDESVAEPVETPTVQSSRFKVQSSISFAHCNFHLRGEDSDRDEKFVTDFAKENNIPLFIKHFDTESYAKENSLSIEMAARELRYAWFKELKEINGFDKVALAHHGDDQIETFFINFLRGSGIKGLKGMKPQNDFYIRPLLWSNRNEIETYAKENGIQWVEDYTNQETVYLRNKIRHNIIPVFDEMKNNARQSLNFSINCLSSENDLYRNLLEEKLSSMEIVDGSYRRVDVGCFLKNENGRQLLFEWVRRYGFNFEQSESMFEAMKNGKSGVIFYNDNGHCKHLVASVQKDNIEIFEERRGDEEIVILESQNLKNSESQKLRISESQKLRISESQNLKNSESQKFKISESQKFKISESQKLRILESQNLRISIIDKDDNFTLIKDPSVAAQFDMDKIKFPLKLRHWRKGDRFRPLGMKGSKLLSDFFNDMGFSTYMKHNVWIMEDAKGLVLWVVGYRINDSAKISDSTKVIFQCTLK